MEATREYKEGYLNGVSVGGESSCRHRLSVCVCVCVSVCVCVCVRVSVCVCVISHVDDAAEARIAEDGAAWVRRVVHHDSARVVVHERLKRSHVGLPAALRHQRVLLHE